MKKIIYYVTEDGKCPFDIWFNKLDKSVKARVLSRIERLEEGHYGDYKCIAEDLYELRLKFASGYRIYFTEQNNIIIMILCAGDKSTQRNDIKKAKEIIENIKE